jgi:hypothetical protein
LLYGALLSAAAIALSSTSTDSARAIVLTTVEVLVVFWAAHVYIRILADRLLDPDATFAARGREALAHEAAVLQGGLPGLGVLCVALLAGVDPGSAGDAALVAIIGVLGSAGYVVGRQAGARGRTLAAEVAVAALLGVLVVAFKVGLH